MAPKKKTKKPIEQYEHQGAKRVNNPPVSLPSDALAQEGLVTPRNRSARAAEEDLRLRPTP